MSQKPHYLREWRKHRRLTQDQVAQLLEAYAERPENEHKDIGKTQATVQRLESGKHKYHQHMMEALSEIYDAPVSALIHDNPLELRDGAQKRDHAANDFRASVLQDFAAGPHNITLQEFVPTHNVPTVGKVTAGGWLEMLDQSASEYDDTPVSVPELAGKKLSGYIVEGTSVNRVFAEGTLLICASPYDRTPEQDDFVVVMDITGPIPKITVKQLVVNEHGYKEFWPRSYDPQHQEPFVPAPRDDMQQDGWEIIGVVVDYRGPKLARSYKPVRF